MYSLVSASILGFDLTRLPGGTAVAEVLLRGLSLTESDLDILGSARLDTWDRLELWHDVDLAARRQPTMREVSAATADDSADPAGVLAVLERVPIGTVDGLLHCVRHDLLDWTWQRPPAADGPPAVNGAGGVPPRVGPGTPEQGESASRASAVLCDAVVAAYLRDLLPPRSRRRLAAGWLTAARWLPARRLDLGPQAPQVHAMLDRLRAAGPDDLVRLARASEVSRRAPSQWAAAVHAASWAVYVAGRVRPAAAAQLMLVQAVDDAAIPVADRAAGVWNLLSGTVQALMVRDALDADTAHRLLEPYVQAMGPAGLTE
jgi:hypothetical protein